MGGPPEDGLLESIAGAGQGLRGLVDLGHPPGGGHNPLAVVHAAHVRLVDELAATGKPGVDGGIDVELKRELSKTQKELKKELFQEVDEKVQEYMKTEDYKHLLVAYIEKAARFAGGEAMTIYINPTDADKKEYLEEHTGMTLTISKEDFIGGVRAVIHERNILIDRAFKGAIDNEYHKFVFKGGAGVE